MIGWPWKWPWKNHSVAVTDLRPTMRLAAGSYSTIRSTSRNGQRCGMSFSISRVERTVATAVSVTLGSSSGGRARSAARGGDERRGANTIEQVRGHAAIHEDLVREDGAVQLDVRCDPVDEQLAQRGFAPSDRRRSIGAPDAELAEERVVVGRNFVAGVDVRVHADADASGGEVGGDLAGLRSEVLCRVLREDPEFDGMAARHDVRLAQAEGFAGGDFDLQGNHVYAGA